MITISTFQIVRERNEIYVTLESGKKDVLHFPTLEKVKEYVKRLFEETSAKFLLSSFRFRPLEGGGIEMQFDNLEDCQVFQEFAAPVLFESPPVQKGDQIVRWEGNGKNLMRCLSGRVSLVAAEKAKESKRQGVLIMPNHPPSGLHNGAMRGCGQASLLQTFSELGVQ